MSNTVLELSTAHITKGDNDELHRMALQELDKEFGSPFCIGEHHYGYFIMVPGDEESLEERMNLCKQQDFGMSDSFWKIMSHAVRNDHRVILLDCDADVVEGFIEHDW